MARYTKVSDRIALDRHDTLLVATVAYAAVVAAVLLGVEGLPTAVRLPLALPLLLVVPGYALVSALLPSRGTADRLSPNSGGNSGPSTLTRLVLAVVASLAVVPMLATAVTVAIGFRLDGVLVGVVAITALASAVAIYRGTDTRGAGTGRDVLAGWVESFRDPLTIVATVVVVVLLGASVAVLGGDPATSEPGTELYAVDDGGTAVGSVSAGTSVSVAVSQDGVSRQSYTVVTMTESDGGVTELDRAAVTVRADQRVQDRYSVPAGAQGTLLVAVYTGEAPEDPDPQNAHRLLRLPIEP